MKRRGSLVPVVLAFGVGCGGGDCSSNAVVVAEEVVRIAPIIDSVEVYDNSNLDALLLPHEQRFVLNPRPSAPKYIKISFLNPVSREQLGMPLEPCDVDATDETNPCPTGFLEFEGSFDPSDPDDKLTPTSWVQSIAFDTMPNDLDGPPTKFVLYRLADDLVQRRFDAIIPIKTTMHLELLDPSLEPAHFAFVLAKRDSDEPRPPRVVGFSPGPVVPLPGWNRPITSADFLYGEQLADLLARVESRIVGDGAFVGTRAMPHGGVRVDFDDPMVNMVVQVTPTPDDPTNPDDPRGVELVAPTLGFATTFTRAESDTRHGMAPDQIYRVEVLSNVASTRAAIVPFAVGTQNDIGLFLTPYFDAPLYVSLLNDGYSAEQLAGHVSFAFRTGPFRITEPLHNGATNATTAPIGRFTAYLQFARPAETIGTPTFIELTLSPRGQATATTTITFPTGSTDTIHQDGFVRTTGVTRHPVPIQLPDHDYDDFVELEMKVFTGSPPFFPTQFLNRDKIRFRHDNIVPTIDSDVVVTNTLESDGKIDNLCIVADCDVTGFILQTSTSAVPVMLSAKNASKSACTNGRQTFCFADVPLGTSLEGDATLSITAIDDQGNKSAAVQVNARPKCQIFDKFIGSGGNLASVTASEAGNPSVAWVNGNDLLYTKAAVDGSWSSNQSKVFSLGADQTFGVGLDLILHPVDAQPVICFVVAPQRPPWDSLGQLKVLKRTLVDPEVGSFARSTKTPPVTLEQYAWREMAHEDNARPLGCSLSVRGNQVVVGWSGVDAARLGFVVSTGLATRNLPMPSTLHRTNLVTWDVDVAGFGGGRVYFTYRTSNPFWNQTIAPGTVVAGYVDGTFSIAQDMSGEPPSTSPPCTFCTNADCPITAPRCSNCRDDDGDGLIDDADPECHSPLQNDETVARPGSFGYGPRIIADEDGVGLAYVSAIETEVFDFESTRSLDVMGAPHPALGAPIVFAPRYRNTEPSPLNHLAADGLARPADGIAVPFGPPALVRGADHRLVVAWSRGGSSEFGIEDIAVAAVDPQTQTAEVTVIDRRVATVSAQRREAIAVRLARGIHGYFAVFRNPAVGQLVFANEHDAPVSTTGTFSCSGAWRTAVIFPDELNLKYQRADALQDDFFDPACAGLPNLPILSEIFPRPWAVPIGTTGAKFPETVGSHETLLHDLAADTFVENGRGLLKFQANVCVPNSGADSCDGPLGAPAQSSCPSNVISPVRLQPPPATVDYPYWQYGTAEEAKAQARKECADGQVMESFDQVGAIYTCYRCPANSVYDPSVNRCVTCPSGDFQYLPNGSVGQIPGGTSDPLVIRSAGLSVRCVSCANCNATTSEFDRSHGAADWIPAAHGAFCTRCDNGQQLYECSVDEQCSLFGSNARCAASGWPSPGRRVCVKACSTNQDCGGPTAIGFCSGGVCYDRSTQQERPSGFDMLCRPIGCDECWKNQYCLTADDCPLQHACHVGSATERVKTPACLMRPFLSPQFEGFVDGAFRGGDFVDIGNQINSRVRALREAAMPVLRKIRIPWRATAGPVVVTNLDPVGVLDVQVRFTAGLPTLVVTVATIKVNGTVFGAGLDAQSEGPITISFQFALHTGLSGPNSPPAENDSDSFSGLKLSLHTVKVTGEFEVEGIGAPDEVEEMVRFALGDLLLQNVGPSIDAYIGRAMRIIGGLSDENPRDNIAGPLVKPDLLRCIFARPDPTNPPFTHRAPSQCSVGGIPPIYNAAAESDGSAITMHFPSCPGGTP